MYPAGRIASTLSVTAFWRHRSDRSRLRPAAYPSPSHPCRRSPRSASADVVRAHHIRRKHQARRARDTCSRPLTCSSSAPPCASTDARDQEHSTPPPPPPPARPPPRDSPPQLRSPDRCSTADLLLSRPPAYPPGGKVRRPRHPTAAHRRRRRSPRHPTASTQASSRSRTIRRSARTIAASASSLITATEVAVAAARRPLPAAFIGAAGHAPLAPTIHGLAVAAPSAPPRPPAQRRHLSRP